MPYPYATAANVKTRLGITGSTSDALLGSLCDQANAFVESVTGRALGSSTVTAELLDGFDALEGGYCLTYPKGIRSVTSLEVAPYTGGTFVTIPSTDYFLRPVEARRTPGWPAFELWMTDIPSDTNALPTIEPGYATVRLTAAIGWAAMPLDVREVAEVTVVRSWQARQAGQMDEVGNDDTGTLSISRLLSGRDMATLRRYRWHPVEII